MIRQARSFRSKKIPPPVNSDGTTERYTPILTCGRAAGRKAVGGFERRPHRGEFVDVGGTDFYRLGKALHSTLHVAQRIESELMQRETENKKR